VNYKQIYKNIINNAKTRDNSSLKIKEIHHFLPFHWLGIGNKNDWNFATVILSPREHFICHLLLNKILPNCPQAIMALQRMINSGNSNYKCNSKIYEKHKHKFIEAIISLRKNKIKDKKRREINSLLLKQKWKTKEYRDKMINLRTDPIKDNKRRDICSKKMKSLNENGLKEKTIKRNKNMDHMSQEQLIKMRHNQKQSVLNTVTVIFLDGIIKKVSKEFYKNNKNKTCYHVSSKSAANILGKPYTGGRPKQKN